MEGRRLARAEDEVSSGVLGLVLRAERDSLALTQDEGADEADDRSGYEVARHRKSGTSCLDERGGDHGGEGAAQDRAEGIGVGHARGANRGGEKLGVHRGLRTVGQA